MQFQLAFAPLLPRELLRRYRCDEPTDTRFRALARLAQSLWRQRQGHACGKTTDPRTGSRRLLGSRLTPTVARQGVNFADPSIVPLVRRELAWREVGALIEEHRLWGNLLSSQALAFSLFLPLKRDRTLATRTLARLFPDLVAEVTDILFEHSPGRGDPNFTGDRTAFDALVRCTTPSGRRAFLAVEVKYTEAPGGGSLPPFEPHDARSRTAHLFRDPDAPELRAGGLGQFWRQSLLASALGQREGFDTGRLVVLAPALNREVWQSVSGFTAHLRADADRPGAFDALTLEAFLLAVADAGAAGIAAALTSRYLDFAPAIAELDRFLDGVSAETPPGDEAPG